MDILAASDFHISEGIRPELDLLYSIIEHEKPPLLVLDGDIGDPWKTPWTTILASPAWRSLVNMVEQRHAQGLKTVWIADNHDHNAKAEYLPGAELYWEYRQGRYVFRHGWQFALDWKVVGPFAFWIAINKPEWMVPLYNWLYRRNTPGQIKARLKLGGLRTDPEAYNWAVQTVHAYARAWAKKNDVFVVIGHTHQPKVSKRYADCGDLLDSMSYLAITGNTKVELKRL